MTGATTILIFFGIFAAIVGGTIIVFFGRVVWAMRNPEKFKAFQEKEIIAASERKQRLPEAERERIRLGKPSWGGRFFGAVFLLSGFAVFVYGAWSFYDLARAQSWAKTECEAEIKDNITVSVIVYAGKTNDTKVISSETKTLSGLAAGFSKEASFDLKKAANGKDIRGKNLIVIRVDPNNKIDELNENNNEFGVSMTNQSIFPESPCQQ